MEYNIINEETKNSNLTYNFEKALSISLILVHIFKYLDRDNIKN